MVSTLEKGNKLEDQFYEYLLDQQKRGELVFGAHPPRLCKIFKKKKYPCKEREDHVEFDVVIELYRVGRSSPHLIIAFECKNHEGNIEEIYVNDFSSKLGRIFKHSAKGVMVVTSRLQSGAANVAKNSKLGIVKYDDDGVDVIADRKGSSLAESGFVKTQIFREESLVKSLKFAAYHSGRFFGSIDQFLKSFDQTTYDDGEYANSGTTTLVPFISDEEIQLSAENILRKIDYVFGPVDLANICSALYIDLRFSDQTIRDGDGNLILGSENFDRNSIRINCHDNKQRERFTIAHEIGHFCLKHDRYLRSETVLERDLLEADQKGSRFGFERLEMQANAFASHLLLPEEIFKRKVAEYRTKLDIRDIGFGYIFVDDQPCNFGPYNTILSELSSYFDVSKQAVQIKLKKMGMLTDQRRQADSLLVSQFAKNLASIPRG